MPVQLECFLSSPSPCPQSSQYLILSLGLYCTCLTFTKQSMGRPELTEVLRCLTTLLNEAIPVCTIFYVMSCHVTSFHLISFDPLFRYVFRVLCVAQGSQEGVSRTASQSGSTGFKLAAAAVRQCPPDSPLCTGQQCSKCKQQTFRRQQPSQHRQTASSTRSVKPSQGTCPVPGACECGGPSEGVFSLLYNVTLASQLSDHSRP